jgi:hypothetical protein
VAQTYACNLTACPLHGTFLKHTIGESGGLLHVLWLTTPHKKHCDKNIVFLEISWKYDNHPRSAKYFHNLSSQLLFLLLSYEEVKNVYMYTHWSQECVYVYTLSKPVHQWVSLRLLAILWNLLALHGNWYNYIPNIYICHHWSCKGMVMWFQKNITISPIASDATSIPIAIWPLLSLSFFHSCTREEICIL